VDSWIYPAIWRLYALGYLDRVFLNIRPWTRASIVPMLADVSQHLDARSRTSSDSSHDEALRLLNAIGRELHYSSVDECLLKEGDANLESAYTLMRGLSGTPLRDTYHLGSTIINDYGRPYANGFNSYTGISGYASAGRFVVYARGELQTAPSSSGYSTELASELSNVVDGITFLNPATGLPYYQATIPLGPTSSTVRGRFLEAYVAANLFGHAFSFGKQDQWLGPAQGSSMAYSNNAENIYGFQIDRTEPLRIPGLSRVTGPFRYSFLVGPMHGHAYMPPSGSTWVLPGTPWMHVEKISFRPTSNVEFGFERTVIWGGKGHAPITLHTFLRSFFSVSAPDPATKNSPEDPGARFSAFDFTYRLPFVRNWFTLYTDSEVHDDISPIDAPRRASIRPGLYLSHVPGLARLDVRAEAAYTDPPITNSQGGKFMYWEVIQRQGYTNNGALFGDWVGREDKGGQAWITYHLSGNEWIQASYRNQKAAKDFIAGGTTLNDFNFQVVKRIKKDIEVNGQFSLEHWKAPIYLAGQQNVTSTSVQVTWYPRGAVHF
jgi:hypothetical protein